MILMVSGRTDVCAFYPKWFENRLKAGFFDVRNPYNEHLVSRIYTEDIHMFNFCTKNPLPIIPLLDEIHKPICFMVTLTGYRKDIEPNVPDKRKILEGIREISSKIGKKNTIVRYDPILLNADYTKEYHIRALDKLMGSLAGSIDHIIISFMQEYKNVKKNTEVLKYHAPTEEEYTYLSKEMDKLSQKYGIPIVTCNNKALDRYGFHSGACISQKYAYELTGRAFPLWHERECDCVELADVAAYNSCPYLCKYCYANFDEDSVMENMKRHNPDSSLLIGELKKDDIIKRRR